MQVAFFFVTEVVAWTELAVRLDQLGHDFMHVFEKNLPGEWSVQPNNLQDFSSVLTHCLKIPCRLPDSSYVVGCRAAPTT